MRKNLETRRRRRVVALVLLVLFSAPLAASLGCRSGKSKSNQIETVDDFFERRQTRLVSRRGTSSVPAFFQRRTFGFDVFFSPETPLASQNNEPKNVERSPPRRFPVFVSSDD